MKNYDASLFEEIPLNGGSYVAQTNDAYEKNNFHLNFVYILVVVHRNVTTVIVLPSLATLTIPMITNIHWGTHVLNRSTGHHKSQIEFFIEH